MTVIEQTDDQAHPFKYRHLEVRHVNGCSSDIAHLQHWLAVLPLTIIPHQHED